MKILYIEDEASLAKIVKESLQSRSYDVLHLADGENLISNFTNFSPDICLFDVMLPVIDGFTLARELRALYPSIPIIFITAKVQTLDVLDGFGAGGNDYIKKPFSLEELIVRINNLYKLSNLTMGSEINEKMIQIGQFTFWPDRLELIYEGVVKRLSFREGQLLGILSENKNEVINRKHILDTLWGDDNFFNSRNLDVYITKLRQYFKQDQKVEILTLKAVGYRLIER
ncbi:MAG: response regulator transcription factor [Saprospiraceae bacterium]|jgi:DNA-binding response OmpR family regulator|nr:response regulator transcription factor [Saprospiraceae bacterium]MBL0027275.1 response regulator transcription factor [Saprospiraceae bacterium]